jgi:hypothetical protein
MEKKFSDIEISNEETADWEDEVSNDPSDTFSLAGTDFYQLSLPISKIALIDQVLDPQNLTKHLFLNAKISGFDCEWKPIMCRAGE